MALTFYPHEDVLESSTTEEKLEIMTDAAERYKAAVLDAAAKAAASADASTSSKRAVPKDIPMAFNWEELSKLMREVRELSEATSVGKLHKAEKIAKLAEIYEVLRGAKMPKLEAIRIALINEANQLRNSASQVS